MKKSKSNPPTFAKMKAGNVPDEWREWIAHEARELAAAAQIASSKINAWEAEALALFDAMHDANLPQAEKYISEHQPSAGAIAFLILVAQDKFKSEQARINGAKSYAAKAKARDFVRGEWAMYKADYENNKSAFARDYVPRLKRELGVEITVKTITERWLV